MPFADIEGQEQAKRILQNGLRNKTLSHAYIFSGPNGSGRRKTATLLAQAVFCLEREDDACGDCIECRKVAHGNHPGLHWIHPEGSSVKIEQIRDLQRQFAYKSAASQTKIYVIDDAEKMTLQASNSLLKFLEEPGSDVVAILITENGHALLPTIRSRAQWVPFLPADPLSTARALAGRGHSAALALPAAHLAAGIDAAEELLQAEWFAEARNVVLQLAKETLTRYPAALLTVQQRLAKGELGERLQTVLDLWILWFKDMIHLQYGRKDNAVYIDQLEWMSRMAFTRDAAFWVAGMEHIIETQKRLRSHANPQLSLEKLIMDIQGG